MPSPIVSKALLTFCALLSGLLSSLNAAADGSIAVRITDRQGRPLPEIAVHAARVHGGGSRMGSGAPQTPAQPVATMDQRDLAFSPHILVVEAGTRIDFPNSDDVRHHVYSFSPTKRFELALYQGSVHAPLSFNEPGLVTLGCNIHDEMLGYILVVDTPYFAITNADGEAKLDSLPGGDYELQMWTPRLRPDKLPESTQVHIEDGPEFSFSYQLEEKLYPPHAHSESSLSWTDY